MDFFQGLILISTVHLLAAASPGPDFVLISQQSLKNGRKAGLLCSLGITLGLSVHIIYSSLGLAAVIASSETLLWAIKILGGGYLCYLGYKGIRAKASNQADDMQVANIPTYSTSKSIGVGFLCNALNPKAPVYFIALFTLVISPDLPLYQLAAYGLWMMMIQMTWFSTVVMLLSAPKVRAKFNAIGHWIDRILGGAMIALGLKVLLTRN